MRQSIWRWRLGVKNDAAWDACFAAIAHAYLKQAHAAAANEHDTRHPVLHAMLGQPEAASLLIHIFISLSDSASSSGQHSAFPDFLLYVLLQQQSVSYKACMLDTSKCVQNDGSNRQESAGMQEAHGRLP